VLAVDVDDAKLKLAKSVGADYGINSRGLNSKEVVAKIREANGGSLADAAIDFVGMPATSSLGFDSLGRGGRLVVVGLFGGEGKFPLPLFPLRAREIIGNFTGTIQDLAEMVELVQRRLVKPVVSETYRLEEVNLVLEKLVAGKIEGRAIVSP
jgi:propanol-preferring alcohol dehydrogenase